MYTGIEEWVKKVLQNNLKDFRILFRYFYILNVP
jgi:hypothetical protein